MVQLTPDLLGSSLVVVLVGYVIALAFQIVMFYLNFKQAKVNNQMKELIGIAREIKDAIRKEDNKEISKTETAGLPENT